MKWLNRFSSMVLGLMALNVLRDFLENNKIFIIQDDEEIDLEGSDIKSSGPKDISELKPADNSKAMDLRGTPTHVCVCGCYIWNLKVVFNQGQIDQYFLDMECAQCGSLATAPTPIDNRNELD